jgi:hypothetical protein
VKDDHLTPVSLIAFFDLAVNQAARDRRPIAQSENEALQVRNHGPGFTLVFYLLEDLAGFGCQRPRLLDAAFFLAPLLALWCLS